MSELVRPKRDLVEIFGYAPNDTSKQCRVLWNLGACPFINLPCHKTNHDKSIVYGTCSVTSPFGDCIICPNRLYANNYQSLRTVAETVFGNNCKFYTYEDFIKNRKIIDSAIVALGATSGKEVRVGTAAHMSMDWVLAKVSHSKLIEYVGIEVQSIDITGNYRDTWHSYKNINTINFIPSSEHGMNWANVHKRLIPQIIRKSLLYSRSQYVKHGLYFIVPDIVYKKFEDIIGDNIPLVNYYSNDVITVHTYSLGPCVPQGNIRSLNLVRSLSFKMDEFSKRFISGPNMPKASELDNAVKTILGVK